MTLFQPPRIKDEQENGFAIALIQALSCTDHVQDLVDGSTDLELATGFLRSLVRGNEDLSKPLSGLGQVVSNFSEERLTECNQPDPANFMEGLLEVIRLENPKWFQDTITGVSEPPSPGYCFIKNQPSETKIFSTITVQNSGGLIPISNLMRTGHLRHEEESVGPSTRVLISKQVVNQSAQAQTKIQKYPKVLIIKVETTEPRTNNIFPDKRMITGNGQRFKLKSIIQAVSRCNFSVLSMTNDEDWYVKSHNDEQTYIEVQSGKRNLEEDYIYIYQEVPECNDLGARQGNNISPQTPMSPLVKEAISNGAQLGINLTPGSQIKSDGNCAFSAIIENINSRACFNMKIDLSPPEARRKWLTESHGQVKLFAGNTIPNFDAQWNALKYSTGYSADTGDYFLPAAANRLKCNILIVNTRHESAHDPIAVVKADKLAEATPRTEVPIVLAYNGSHYEHLIPASEEDIQKTVDMVNLYTSGTDRFKWAHDYTLTYSQAVSTKPHAPDIADVRSDIPNPQLTTSSKSNNKGDSNEPSKRCRKSNLRKEVDSLTPTKKHLMPQKTPVNFNKTKIKRIKLADPPADYCINLSNRFDLLEEEADDEPTISMQQPMAHPSTSYVRRNKRTFNKLKIQITLTPTDAQEINNTDREARSTTKQVAPGQNSKRKRNTSISIDRELVHKHLKPKDATRQMIRQRKTSRYQETR